MIIVRVVESVWFHFYYPLPVYLLLEEPVEPVCYVCTIECHGFVLILCVYFQ